MIAALIIAWVISVASSHHFAARRGRPAEGFVLALIGGPLGAFATWLLILRPTTPRARGSGVVGRFLAWVDTLLAPRTSGMDDGTPRTSIVVYLVMAGLLALQVVARYKWGFLAEKEYQAAHMLIGWVVVLVVLRVAHGPSILRRISGRTWALLAVAAVCLTVFWYLGRSDSYRRFFGEPPADLDSMWPLVPFGYFVFGAVFYRLVVPFAFARWAFGLTPRQLGLPIGGIREPHPRGIGWIYLVAFLAILPGLVFASHGSDYLAKYPMARDIVSPEQGIWIGHFVVYEVLYAFVFVSGESFWRGYLTFGCEKDLGLYSLPLMLVPYVTAHFGKPFSEALGAIVAGTLLGFLALKHRSVWFGVALHYGVALVMDLLAVVGNGFVLWS